MPKKPDAYETKTCPVCGNEFRYLKSWPLRTCSRSCAAKLRHLEGRLVHVKKDPSKWTATNCPTCGKQFEFLKSWPRVYCSHECAGKANITNIKHYAPTGYDTTCEICGIAFHADSTLRGRFCSRACMAQWMSKCVRGPAHPLYGRKLGRPKYFPPPTRVICHQCGKEYSIKPSWKKYTRFCSRVCHGKWESLHRIGPRTPNWRGGHPRYYGPSWLEARRQVRTRDKVCQGCGISPEQTKRALDVHHLTPFRVFGVARHLEANALTNLVALCNACHKKWEIVADAANPYIPA